MLVALRVGDRLGFAEVLQNVQRGREPAGIRIFGDTAYQAFIVGPPRTDGLANLATYIPLLLRVEGDGLPDHFIHCVGESDFPKKGSANCSIVAGYFDVVASLGVYDFGGDSPPLPYDRFPEFPAEIRRVLELADVTGDVERWIGRLPVIE